MIMMLVLMACQQEDKRSDTYAEAVCDLHNSCETLEAFGYDSSNDCIEQAEASGSSIAEDKDAWESCIDELYNTSCEDLYQAETLPSCLPNMESN